MNTRPLQLILLTLTAFAAIAQPAPHPTPIPGERVSDFIQRYDNWVDSVPMEDRAWPEMQRVDTIINEALSEFGGPTSDPTDGDQWDRTTAFIENHPEVIQAIHEYAARPFPGVQLQASSHLTDTLGGNGYAIANDPSPKYIEDIAPKHFKVLMTHSFLLIAHIEMLRQADDIDGIMLDIEALFGMGRLCSTTGSVLDQSMAQAFINIIIRHVLRPHSIVYAMTPQQLKQIDRFLLDLDAMWDTHALLNYESIAAHDFLEWIYEDSTDNTITHQGILRCNDVAWGSSLAAMLNLNRQQRWLISTHELEEMQPYFEQKTHQSNAITGQITAIQTIMRHPLHQLHHWPTILDAQPEAESYKLIPAHLACHIFHSLPGRTVIFNTKLNATRLLLAAHRHKLTRASFPESLEDFDPAILTFTPTDLFTGQPLHYKLIDAHPLIYSNGTDRDDDHATPANAHDFIPLDELSEILKSNPASIDGDWILYPAP